MGKRDQYARYFGPKKDEAAYLWFLAQINILRGEQGLPGITTEQFLDAVLNDVQHLPDYEWMEETP